MCDALIHVSMLVAFSLSAFCADVARFAHSAVLHAELNDIKLVVIAVEYGII